jgi:single-strand DNA-binding protein
MLNQCQFIGRLGADPETRRMANGDPVVNLRLAVSERWRDKSGERQERTEWITVVIFNENIAKLAEQYLRKGSMLFVSGKLQTREWQDKEGQKRYSTEIVLQRFRGELTLLDSKGDRDDDARPEGDSTPPRNGYADAKAGRKQATNMRDYLSDEIPF